MDKLKASLLAIYQLNIRTVGHPYMIEALHLAPKFLCYSIPMYFVHNYYIKLIQMHKYFYHRFKKILGEKKEKKRVTSAAESFSFHRF